MHDHKNKSPRRELSATKSYRNPIDILHELYKDYHNWHLSFAALNQFYCIITERLCQKQNYLHTLLAGENNFPFFDKNTTKNLKLLLEMKTLDRESQQVPQEKVIHDIMLYCKKIQKQAHPVTQFYAHEDGDMGSSSSIPSVWKS